MVYECNGTDFGASFGNNDRNSATTGILRDFLWNSPTLRTKCEAAPDVPIGTGRCLSMVGESGKKAIDSNTGFW